MLHRVMVLAVVFLSMSGFASANTISVDAYLELVRDNHPFFAREQLQTSIEESRRERFLGRENWLVESSPVYRQPAVAGSWPVRPQTSGLFATQRESEPRGTGVMGQDYHCGGRPIGATRNLTALNFRAPADRYRYRWGRRPSISTP